MVKVDYQILGQPLSFQTEMMQIDGRWYGKDTITQIEKEVAAVEQPVEATIEAAEAGEPMEPAEIESDQN
jgi:hypothetical protein